MLKRIIAVGEKLTGVDMPPSSKTVELAFAGESYICDPYTTATELDKATAEARQVTRDWWMDVAKCAINDVIHRATFSHNGYLHEAIAIKEKI